ncbi:DUF1192 family protein [Novosphingobium sp. FSY-8]|uniref:DUF1192 family protein n=1 Tax=Novosphingobium ovatum TaxID=1908523 RepID=A0ABW9XHK6_9SPHN|nr:DUF1192 domain-containing protein [Novosphingobium ovatum]NBC37943.1 DUF1192 family protein [Novosphingobium ovatum]
MDDDDRPLGSGGARKDAASLLSAESLDSYSLDELDARITTLQTEIERVTAHKAKSAAHRLAAEALFRPRSS